MRKSVLVCVLCLMTGCAVLGLPRRPQYDPSLADSLEVGQWCRVDTEQYTEGEGPTKTRYVGRVERISGQSICLSEVTIHTRKVRDFRHIYRNRALDESEAVTEHSAMFILPRDIITSVSTVSPRDAAESIRPVGRIGIDFDVNLDKHGNIVD